MRGKEGMPRLFVTGASGLLGANFVAAAASRYSVVACHCHHPWRWPGAESVGANLMDAAATDAVLARVHPDVIVHLAAATNVDRCEDRPDEAEELNVRVTERLAAYANASGARMVFMSTDSVFDGSRSGYAECDAPRPLNVYARTKLQAEFVVRNRASNHLIIRGNMYGWNAQDKVSLAEWVVGRLESAQDVPAFADVIFAPLLVNSLAEIVIQLIDRNARGVVHVASRDAMSKYEFATAIATEFNLSAERIRRTSMAEARLKAPRPLNTALVCGRLAREFHIPLPTIRDDLARFRALRENGFVARLKATLSPAHENN